MLPCESAALPTGWVRTVRPRNVLGTVAITSPSGETTETVAARLLTIQALPWASIAAPKGFICGSPASGTGPSGMLTAASGSPPGNMVTESLPQLAIQMLPFLSDTVPCGHEMSPFV